MAKTQVVKLSSNALARFAELRKEIREALGSRNKLAFIIGTALLEIREQELWRDGFNSFKHFVKTEYQLTRPRAYQLMTAAEVKKSLPANVSTIVDNEAQARALSEVPESQRASVLKQASEAGSVTAQSITETAQTLNAIPAKPEPDKKENEPRTDHTGHKMPTEIIADWDRAAAFNAQRTQLSRIKCELDKAIEEHDPIFAEITNTTSAHLHNAYSTLERVLPYCVCPKCNGRGAMKRCGVGGFCHGRGFVSKFQFSHLTEAEKKLWMKAGAV